MQEQLVRHEDRGAAPMVDMVDDCLPVEIITKQVKLIRECMRAVMKDGTHYGRIPGTPKESLWQPGADVLNRLFRLRAEFEVISPVRQPGFIAYVVQCKLVHIPSGNLVATALGSCNSREQKYDRTITKRQCSPWELDNTLLKMAEKRAKVGAVLNATAASEMFTQDIEDDAPLPEAPKRGRGRPRKQEAAAPPVQDSREMPHATDVMREPGSDDDLASAFGGVGS